MQRSRAILLAFIGSKLAGKKPDKKHPFGHGRMEYISALVIGILILYAGFSLIVDSVKGIFTPSELSVSVLSIFIIAFTAIIKFLLGIYTMFTGKKLDSTTLIAVGLDSDAVVAGTYEAILNQETFAGDGIYAIQTPSACM